MGEKIYLLFLNLNHAEPQEFYESLDTFLDAQTRTYLYVTAHNRALILQSNRDKNNLYRLLVQRCAPGRDHVFVRELKTEDRLPVDSNQQALVRWLSLRDDWLQWRKSFQEAWDDTGIDSLMAEISEASEKVAGASFAI